MNVAGLVDATLELPIAPSFARLGYDLRSRTDGWRDLGTYDLTGRVMLITGATSGLGLAAAHRLAASGATLVLLGRNPEKTERVRDEVATASGNDHVTTVIADMGDLGAVRRAADSLRADHDRIDVVVHNAGALDPERRLTADGIETTIASQVVGPFLLTSLLLDRMTAAADDGTGRPSPAGTTARVLTMSSGGMYAAPLDVDHLEMNEQHYRGSDQYARAKRAQVTLNELWSERAVDREVVFHAVHPGWADTPGVESSLPRFHTLVGPLLRSPDQGADTLAWLASDDGAPLESSGKFWLDRRTRPIHRLPTTRRSDTPAERERLWDWCVQRSGADAALLP